MLPFTALLFTLLIGAIAPSLSRADTSRPTVLTITTGSPNGVYYPTGNAICRLLNRGAFEHGVRCLAVTSQGSVANLARLRRGEADLAIVQADWLQRTLDKGTSDRSALGAVMGLHSEALTLVTGPDSDIETLDDLPGQRVNIGDPGAGQRATFATLMALKGWTQATFGAALELPAAEQSRALCDGRLDVAVYVVGHPNGGVLEATTACDSRLLPLTEAAITALDADLPHYRPTTIPGGFYRGHADPTATIGIPALLVARRETDAGAIRQLVAAVFDNFDQFRRFHPALSHLDPAAMATPEGLPLHPGAAAYFEADFLMTIPPPLPQVPK
ncbi:MAG: TAXI family TRAP transporter solute-binding subunit [Candidatus Competibacterales bacterium]